MKQTIVTAFLTNLAFEILLQPCQWNSVVEELFKKVLLNATSLSHDQQEQQLHMLFNSITLLQVQFQQY